MKRFLSFTLVLMMAAILVLPIFATGSGTVNDPYVMTDGTNVELGSNVALPIYFTCVHYTSNAYGVRSTVVLFEQGKTYYLYIPRAANSFRLYLQPESQGNDLESVTTTRVRTDDRFMVYRFVPLHDSYGFRMNLTVSDSVTCIIADRLYDSASVTEWAVALAGTTFQVGNSLLQLVMSHWLVLVSVVLFVAVGSVGMIRKLLKGV